MDSEGLAQEAVPHTSGSRERDLARVFIYYGPVNNQNGTVEKAIEQQIRPGVESMETMVFSSCQSCQIRFPEANAITTARESRCHRFPRLVRLYLGAQLSRVSFSPRSIHAPAFLQSKHRRQEERTREKVF